MNVPKVQRHYCPHCKRHQKVKVTIYKKGKERENTAQGWRRYHRKQRGYGTQSKPIFKRNAKVNKRTMPLFTCEVCKHVVHGKSVRMKKYELQ